MQNFALLQEAGRANRPVLLKRGMACTVEEWLLSAEYVLSQGNYQVILCERGIRTFETGTRNTFDVSAIPLAQSLTHLPVMADPSHATGLASLVPACTLAALAAGADGILLEVAPVPVRAVSDGAQTIDFAAFAGLMASARALLAALGRGLAEPATGTPNPVAASARP
jgi:3-deoxy-7-phosphoheptulonate synthase